jgi:hypothetical protein
MYNGHHSFSGHLNSHHSIDENVGFHLYEHNQTTYLLLAYLE